MTCRRLEGTASSDGEPHHRPESSSSSSDETSSKPQRHQPPLWLRVVQINDIYTLDNFPSLLNLIRRCKSDDGEESDDDDDDDDRRKQQRKDGTKRRPLVPDEVLVVVAGDFLAPYLLSSLDCGNGMVDCLNALGVTHACLGNHETDIPPHELALRIRQSEFKWINTNLPELPSKLADALRQQKQQQQMRQKQQSAIAVGQEQQQQQQEGEEEGQVLLDIDGRRAEGSAEKETTTTTAATTPTSVFVVDTPSHDVVTVSNGAMSKKVGLLGLLADDPTLYRPNSFAGAVIQPVISCAESFLLRERKRRDRRQRQRNLEEPEREEEEGHSDDGDPEGEEEVDLWIPMTHQSIQDDRSFARHFGSKFAAGEGGDGENPFPVVLGGHDHEVYDEVVEGCRIVKAGQDAVHAAVTDIVWENDGNDGPDGLPTIDVHFEPVDKYDPDPGMVRRVEGHHSIIKELERATLFPVSRWVSDGEVFSTRGNRLGTSAGTSAMCEMLRMGMRCDVCVVNAGSVRGNRDYPADHSFTWSDLKDEIPFPTYMVAIRVPGRVVEECIRHSRKDSRRRPVPVAQGGYIHTCHQIHYQDGDGSDNGCGRILTVQGEPFDPCRDYLVAMPSQFFQGIDDHRPLLDWAKKTGYRCDFDAAHPAKLVIVQLFSSLVWLRMGSFDEIDADHDGVVTRDDVRRRLSQVMLGGGGQQQQQQQKQRVSELAVDSVFSVADLNGTGAITPLEMILIEFCAADSLGHIDDADQSRTFAKIAARVLGVSENDDGNNRGGGGGGGRGCCSIGSSDCACCGGGEEEEGDDEKDDKDDDAAAAIGAAGCSCPCCTTKKAPSASATDNATMFKKIVQEIRHRAGSNRDGKIGREEVMQMIGELNRKDLLN